MTDREYNRFANAVIYSLVGALVVVSMLVGCAGTGEALAVGGGTATAALMSQPAGWLVAALSGLVIAFIGLFMVAKGHEADARGYDMDTSSATWMWWLILIPLAFVLWKWRGHEFLGWLSDLKRRRR